MRKFVIFLLLLAVLMLVAACGPNDGDENSTTPAGSNTDNGTETQPLWANLPDIKLSGYEFRIFEATPSSVTGIDTPQGDVATMTGDIINDAIYNRNRQVEERFDVAISTQQFESSSAVAKVIQNSVSSGDDVCALALTDPARMVTLSLSGYLYNLWDIEYLDLTQPWYSQQQVNDFTIYDKLYLLMGDFAYSTYLFGAALVYNVDLADELSLPDLYEIVKTNQWTLDKMYEVTENVPDDLNGDGKFVEDDDRFAFAIRNTNNLMNFQYCSGLSIVKFNKATNNYELDFNAEKMQTVLEKVNALFAKNRTIVAENYIDLFNSGRLLMRTTYIGGLFEHHSINDNFRPIPYPKFDTQQEKYLSMMTASVLVMGMPKSVQDTSSAGLILEAMSEKSYGELKEGVYEQVLSYQTMRDEKSLEMLRLIGDGLIIDFGYLTDTGSIVRYIIGDCVASGSTSVASYYASKEKSLKTFYDRLFDTYSKLS